MQCKAMKGPETKSRFEVYLKYRILELYTKPRIIMMVIV